MHEQDQNEIDDSISQASASLMLRVWEEVSKIFLDFFTQSKNTPYKNVKTTFRGWDINQIRVI